MIISVQSGRVQVSLWDPAVVIDPLMNNFIFLRIYIVQLIAKHFQNVSRQDVQHFVTTMFSLSHDLSLLKAHFRDFLVKLKEFSAGEGGGDNADLYQEETAAKEKRAHQRELAHHSQIPGMIPQKDLEDQDMMD